MSLYRGMARKEDAARPGAAGPAWLSLGTAVVVLAAKSAAYLVTGSRAVLADALESVVNVVAAAFMVVAVRVAALPPDENHPWGHGKIEFLSAGFEGALILAAAAAIGVDAGSALLSGDFGPRHIETGLLLVVGATAANAAVGLALLGRGKTLHSAALEADGRHLLSDVVTSAGSIGGLLAVRLTGLPVLDPLAALGSALLIVVSGFRLLRRSLAGMMDEQDPGDAARLREALAAVREPELLGFSALRSRHQGSVHLVDVTLLVRPELSVSEGYSLAQRIAMTLEETLHASRVTCHVAPGEAPSEG